MDFFSVNVGGKLHGGLATTLTRGSCGLNEGCMDAACTVLFLVFVPLVYLLLLTTPFMS